MSNEKILESAKALFKQNGVKKITVDAIAHKAEISKKTFYEHYLNKQEVVDAVLESILSDNYKKLKAIKKGSQNPLEQLQQILNVLSLEIENINPNFIAEVKILSETTYTKYLNYLNTRLFALIREVIIKGKKDGIFRREIDSKIIAKYSLELIKSALRNQGMTSAKLHTSGLFNYFLSGVITRPQG